MHQSWQGILVYLLVNSNRLPQLCHPLTCPFIVATGLWFCFLSGTAGGQASPLLHHDKHPIIVLQIGGPEVAAHSCTSQPVSAAIHPFSSTASLLLPCCRS